MIAKSFFVLNKKASSLGISYEYSWGKKEASSYHHKMHGYAKEVREIDLIQRCEQPDKVAYSIWRGGVRFGMSNQVMVSKPP
jgi:hypothetical protein